MLKLLLWPVLIPSFLLGTALGAMAPVMVLAALDLGASSPFASALVGAMGAVALLLTVPVGVLIDRLGDRRAMSLATATAVGTIVASIVALTTHQPWSLWLFVAAALGRAPALTAWNLARQAAVADAVPTEQRGRAMTALGGTMRAGNLVGPLCSAALLAVWPLWSVFAFAALCATVGTLLLAWPRLNATFEAQAQRHRTEATSPKALDEPVAWGRVTLVGIAITTLGVARIGQPIIVALWGVHLGWHASSITFLVAVGSAIELVLMPLGGHLKDSLGRTPTLVACLVTYGTGYLLAPLWPASTGFIVAMVVMSVGNGLGAGINMTIGADLSPARGRARFLSIWAMFTQVGQLGGPALIAALLATASLPVSVAAIGLSALAGGVWTLAVAPFTRLPGRIDRSAPTPAEPPSA